MDRLIDLRQQPAVEGSYSSMDEETLMSALEDAYAARLQAVLRGSTMELASSRRTCEDLEGAWLDRRRRQPLVSLVASRDSSYYLG